MAVYLDHNATTALDEAVLEAMLPYMGAVTGNPASVHRFGRLQKDAIEQARQQVASLVGAHPEQVVFTSGGTESNNLLLRGVAQKVIEADTNRLNVNGKRIAISAIEHMSLIEPAMKLAELGLPVDVDYLPVDTQGRIDTEAMAAIVDDHTVMVSVMQANNETGVLQDMPALVEIAERHNCFFHSDASQAAGKIPVDFRSSGLHAMTLSAHKFYGPLGVGALVVDSRMPIKALQYGGKQEMGLRAGTENVPAIVGFGKAAELAAQSLGERSARSRQLRDQLESGLNLQPAVHIFSEEAERLPNTVQFGVEGFDGETLLMQLDRRAIAVSSGSACTSGKGEPSHVLMAMAVERELANSAIRVSFGATNTEHDVEVLLKALADIIESNKHSAVMMAAGV